MFVVATPIGNLEDITLRALRVLREVALVAAEDTRRTGNLLRHYEIHTPLLSVHAHNERLRAPQVLARLEAGESVALVTDAGTPGISDPGAEVVAAAREGGYRVEPVPGPSSVITALSVSGRTAEPFAFLGFPPIRSNDRLRFWQRVRDLAGLTVVVFEAPHRALRTLAELRDNLAERPIMVARELTKAHEEVVGGTHDELIARLGEPRGEITILISPVEPSTEPTQTFDDDQIRVVFGEITKSTELDRRAVIREVAKRTGLAPKAVYAALERSKQSVV